MTLTYNPKSLMFSALLTVQIGPRTPAEFRLTMGMHPVPPVYGLLKTFLPATTPTASTAWRMSSLVFPENPGRTTTDSDGHHAFDQ